MTTMTMMPMVTSNLTLKELVKLVDVSVASRYDADLTQFTCIIADDMRNTLESFKTDMHNTLPRQVRSVVHQIQGEAQNKQPVGLPSTPYPGNTSAPGNIGTPYLGNTSSPSNIGTPYLGNTSALVTWAHSTRVALLHRVTRWFWSTLAHHTRVALQVTLFMLMLVHHIRRAHPWVIRGFLFPTASIPYPGGASTSGNTGLPTHVTQPNSGVSSNF
jgi:hypothetical protein